MELILLFSIIFSLQIQHTIAELGRTSNQPNIVFVMLDDVGFADLSYNNENNMIPTPNIDKLVSQGIKFDWYYSHPTCTPSRASLMTARYSCDVGLPFAMIAKSPAGLPLDVPTLPQLLRKQGYAAHMVGKWHLGFATWAQTPVGRGFETHVGNFAWDLTSYEKQIFREPWVPLALDWVRCDEERNFIHFAEARHATTAITSESLSVLHKFGFGGDSFDATNCLNPVTCIVKDQTVDEEEEEEDDDDDDDTLDGVVEKPLFLYVAYTAAHAPAQPTPEHEKICTDLTLNGKPRFPHLWRRLYCGMVVGPDEGVGNLTELIEQGNGRDTVMVLASDNGGSTWFGGLNYPLRGSKTTVFEGGCRVPAFAMDFSTDKRFFGPGGRTFGGLMHFSDWLPTFLGLAGMSSAELESLGSKLHWDGVNQGPAIRAGAESWKQGARKSVLYELSLEGESVFDGNVQIGYRYENWKCVAGIIQDPFYYYESTKDKMNSTDTSYVPVVGEFMLRVLDAVFGVGPMDSVRSAITHGMFHAKYTEPQFKEVDQAKHAYYEKVHVEEPHGDDPSKMRKSFSSLLARKRAAPLPLLAPYGGEEGCGLHLAAVLSGMQLYDLDVDPEERFDIASQHPDIVQNMTDILKELCLKRPQQQRYWLSLKLEMSSLLPMYATGDCSMNPSIPPNECRFQHPFLPDDFKPESLELVNGKEELMKIFFREIFKNVMCRIIVAIVLLRVVKYMVTRDKK